MAAYYNEIDEAAAHVLRELISRGVVAAGEVDTRSIKEVQPSDLRGFSQCHFFAGGGLWSVAARTAGWPDDRPLWTGSCPCQPFSVAGKGAGENDPRHLWPDFFRLIRACRPTLVMGEQVAGKAGYGWFDGVRSDLEGENYASRAVDIPACSVDAPHIRQRLYWIASDMGDAGQQSSKWDAGRFYSAEAGERGARVKDGAFAFGPAIASSSGRELGMAYAELPERRQDAKRWPHVIDGADAGREKAPGRRELDCAAHGRGVALGDAYSAGQQQHGGAEPVRSQQPSVECASGLARSSVGHADASHDGWREGRSEHGVFGGRDSAAGVYRPNGSFWSDHEWRAGADGKARRVKPGLRLLVDGMVGRVGLLRIGGNGIVPQLAAEVIKAFLETEELAA